MITKVEKIEYLEKKGVSVLYHAKLQKSGYMRIYIDEINEIKFTTATADQTTASQTLDALYWSHKLQEVEQ